MMRNNRTLAVITWAISCWRPREIEMILASIAVYLRYGDGQSATTSTLASTQRGIGFAFGACGSGLGSSCLAARRRHHGHDGLGYPGPACAALPCDLGGHDGGNDVSDRRAHDPHFP